MMNTLDKNDQTPLNLAKQSLQKLTRLTYEQQCKKSEAIGQLILLFKEHSELTTQKLQDLKEHQQAARDNEQHTCLICRSFHKNMMTIPCDVHPDHVCINCYNELFSTHSRCPSCGKFVNTISLKK